VDKGEHSRREYGSQGENKDKEIVAEAGQFSSVAGQFEFRFTGKGPSTSLKNRTNSATEIIAIHQGLRTIGNNSISSHSHQGVRDHRLPPDFVGWSSIQGKSTPELPLDPKVKSHVNGLEF
jgi:hypothetical protein